MTQRHLDGALAPTLEQPGRAMDAEGCTDIGDDMIIDEEVREAFSTLYAAAIKRPERARLADRPLPPDPFASLRARDAELQRRQDRGLDRPREPRPVVKYIDPPADAKDLAHILDDYRYFFGQVRYFPLQEMAAMRLPIVVWQHVFSSARKKMEIRFDAIKEPGKYCLQAAKRERAYVRLI